MFDAVVVITEGTVAGIGKRGTVAVPNDSVGIDTSGHYIATADGAALRVGEPADLFIYRNKPTWVDGKSLETAVARFSEGTWRTTEAP